MKFLLDVQSDKVMAKAAQYPQYVCGQLVTPLTRYRLGITTWAMDNGAFSQFDTDSYRRILATNRNRRGDCLFVTVPDIVGSARRTLEVFDHWFPLLQGWRIAMVLQDGIEDLPIPWHLLDAIFVGGSTGFKDGQAAADCVKAALCVGCHVHVGRVNTVRRYRHFEKLGAHTCDGSGVCRYDWMLERIASGATDDNLPLFDKGDSATGPGGGSLSDSGGNVTVGAWGPEADDGRNTAVVG